jgi:hypothetical protein
MSVQTGIKNYPGRKVGATFTFQFNWAPGGVTAVLTGYTARLVLGYANDPTNAVVLEATTANGRIVLGGTPSNIVVTFDKALMATVAPGDYVYDLELTSPGGIDTALMTGRIELLGSKAGA